MPPPCQHKSLQLTPSPFAEAAGFIRPNALQRHAASTQSNRTPCTRKPQIDAEAEQLSSSFPAPLVLPKDELARDPDSAPQSFSQWLNDEARNSITTERKTLYIASAPAIDDGSDYIRAWTKPNSAATALPSPSAEDIADYLKPFYHSLPIKILPNLRFQPWPTQKFPGKSETESPEFISLAYEEKTTRIRVRPPPSKPFPYQLNATDILDFATAILPEDAYAMLLLIEHDIYSDSDNDDFCCGRAYGGRVAIVQTARYNPLLDKNSSLGVDNAHVWPASHCRDFIDKFCAAENVVLKTSKLENGIGEDGPIRAAITAVSALPTPSSTEDLRAVWLARVCRAAAHEVGHCFGMQHCVYYACLMQGSGGVAEEGRQPPYLCPVCLGKVGYAIGCEMQQVLGEDVEREYVRERYEGLVRFCGIWPRVRMFAGYEAWLRARIEVVKGEEGCD